MPSLSQEQALTLKIPTARRGGGSSASRPLGTFLPSPLPYPAASIKGIELFCPASPSETLPTPPLSLRLGTEG